MKNVAQVNAEIRRISINWNISVAVDWISAVVDTFDSFLLHGVKKHGLQGKNVLFGESKNIPSCFVL